MPDPRLLRILPDGYKAGDTPVFDEPWQAQAFALVVKLHERGLFTWTEWAEALGAEIASACEDDDGSAYYHHWLTALEKLIEAKGAMTGAERQARHKAWDAAARATPHGQPIVLKNN